MKYIALIINISVCIVTLGCYAAPYVEPSQAVIFPVLSVMTPYVLGANFLCLLYWILFPSKYFWIPVITLLLGFSTFKRHFNFFQSGVKVEEKSLPVTISSVNINSGQYLRVDRNNLDSKKMASLRHWTNLQADTDIICTQEKRYFGQVMLDSMLSKEFTRHGNDTIGTGIYTRHSMLNKGFIDVGGNTHYVAWADIQLSTDVVVRVYSMHGSSNMISSKSKELIKESNLKSPALMSEIKGLFANYARYASQRNSQYDRLENHISQSPYPVILAGDMNDVPQSYLYQRLTKRLNDAFNSKGKGIGATYRALPGLRIDYIFADDQLVPQKFLVDRVDISDHYPVRAQFFIQVKQ